MLTKYTLTTGTATEIEVSEEVSLFLEENDRCWERQQNYQRNHCSRRLEAMQYEGMELAYHQTPETILILKENAEEMEAALSLLTETQRRRLVMTANGMTCRAIAEIEHVDFSCVAESIRAARKKMIEFYREHPHKIPIFLDHSEKTFL